MKLFLKDNQIYLAYVSALSCIYLSVVFCCATWSLYHNLKDFFGKSSNIRTRTSYMFIVWVFHSFNLFLMKLPICHILRPGFSWTNLLTIFFPPFLQIPQIRWYLALMVWFLLLSYLSILTFQFHLDCVYLVYSSVTSHLYIWLVFRSILSILFYSLLYIIEVWYMDLSGWYCSSPCSFSFHPGRDLWYLASAEFLLGHYIV